MVLPCNQLLPSQHNNTIYFDQSDLIDVHIRLPHGQQPGSAYVRRPYYIVGTILPAN
ncbi:hypothetical protein EYF80_058484 [Liparis tanakae]|uniref:Uncharacterized protein n=1 Tax=Liparis tanakae TaxID=230148 RepID=A0A4Z2ESM7_9TELE|nr:hypothetical protein EYF80_058484 [Liparis tanakae]